MRNRQTAAGQTQDSQAHDSNGFTPTEILFLLERIRETRDLFQEKFSKNMTVRALANKTQKIALQQHQSQNRSHRKSGNRPPVTKRRSKKDRRRMAVPAGVS